MPKFHVQLVRVASESLTLGINAPDADSAKQYVYDCRPDELEYHAVYARNGRITKWKLDDGNQSNIKWADIDIVDVDEVGD